MGRDDSVAVAEGRWAGYNGPVSELTVAPADVERLARLVEKHDLSELRYEEGELRITLRTTVAVSTAAPAAASTVVHTTQAVVAPAAVTAPKKTAKGTPIPSPIMGVFYRAPKPGEPNYVDVGDVVEVGQTIGMIEAMKVFSPIPAEIAGTVVACTAENGKLVQPGDPLIYVEPAA